MKLNWIILPEGEVEIVQCKVCQEYKIQIITCKKFSDGWIKDSKNPTSDGVKKHVTSEMLKRTADLAPKKELGPKQDAKIPRLFYSIHYSICFFTAFYLAKNEEPFTDLPYC